METSLSRNHCLLRLLVICFSSLCLLWQLDGKSLWIDELVTAEIVRQPKLSAVIASVVETEGRPPLYYILLHYWTFLVGNSDSALRLFSCSVAILCLPLLYVLARHLTNERVALISLGLLAFSPLFLLYSRMARAYFMGVFLALAASYFLIRLLDRETRFAWTGYVLSGLTLLYTDYMAASILLAHNLFILSDPRQFRRIWPRWLIAQSLLIIGFLAWLPSMLVQMARYLNQQTLPDLARGWLSFLVKLAQPAFVFSAGETIFPWNPVALLGFPLMILLAIVGTITAWRHHRPMGLLIILSTLVPVFFTVFIFTVLTMHTFAWVGARSLPALPFYLLLVAVGWHSIQQPTRRYLLVAVIGIVFLVSGLNYFRDREFHNPVYVIPSRKIVERVVGHAQAGDIIVAPGDSVFRYYYPSDQMPYPVFDSGSLDEVQAYISSQKSPRVWMVTVSRDRNRHLHPAKLIMWLESNYLQVGQWGYAEQSPVYRRFKTALTGREAYHYKAELTLYAKRP
jgi:mannosyltransferase